MEGSGRNRKEHTGRNGAGGKNPLLASWEARFLSAFPEAGAVGAEDVGQEPLAEPVSEPGPPDREEERLRRRREHQAAAREKRREEQKEKTRSAAKRLTSAIPGHREKHRPERAGKRQAERGNHPAHSARSDYERVTAYRPETEQDAPVYRPGPRAESEAEERPAHSARSDYERVTGYRPEAEQDAPVYRPGRRADSEAEERPAHSARSDYERVTAYRPEPEEDMQVYRPARGDDPEPEEDVHIYHPGQPIHHSAESADEPAHDGMRWYADAKRTFSCLGFGALAILLIGTLLQTLLALILDSESEAALWIVTFVPLYCVAVPVGVWLMRKAPAFPNRPRRLGFWNIIVLIPICIFLTYAGNILGSVLTSFIGSRLGSEVTNPVEVYAMGGSLVLRVVFFVILAPLVEEYIFRKTLIDRMQIYGERLAVITSALMFGLFHGNLSQFFYAFTLGLAFGYAYVKTGRIRYSLGLHMFINLIGGVISPILAENADLDSLEGYDFTNLLYPGSLQKILTPGLAAYAIYVLAMIVLSILGLVFLCSFHEDVEYDPVERELPRGRRFTAAWFNPGMGLFAVACLILIAVSLFL